MLCLSFFGCLTRLLLMISTENVNIEYTRSLGVTRIPFCWALSGIFFPKSRHNCVTASDKILMVPLDSRCFYIEQRRNKGKSHKGQFGCPLSVLLRKGDLTDELDIQFTGLCFAYLKVGHCPDALAFSVSYRQAQFLSWPQCCHSH